MVKYLGIILIALLSLVSFGQNAISVNSEVAPFTVVNADVVENGIEVSWILGCGVAEKIENANSDFIIKYLVEADAKRAKLGIDGVNWLKAGPFSSDSSSFVISDLDNGQTYVFSVGYSTTGDLSNESSIVWSDSVKEKTKEGWGLMKVLVLIGALGFFIFGMKIMSEGIQKLAGNKLRNILGKATANRFAGVLTGFTTTSIIQSSSATTVMVVSFVNAGLLSLRQAIGVIMGANIGTTVTSFLLLVFAFGKFSISDYSLPIIAFGMPMLFFNKSSIKSLGEFLIGFAILFMGLDALKEVMSFIKDDPAFLSNIVEPLTQFGYFSVIIFVLIGTLLTIVVQSSSAAMAITLSLVGASGLPMEYAAAIILGENIGTTVTANLAAMIGNVHAKRAARAHLLFNLIGVVWMLIVFYPFLDMIQFLITETFFSSLVKEEIAGSNARWSLAVFHLVFNILNTALLLGFVNKLEKFVVKMVPSKDDGDEIFKLDFIGGPMGSTADLCILEAKKEVAKFGNLTDRMNGFVISLLNSTDRKVKKSMYSKLEKYEEITDSMEIEITSYLGKSAQLEMSSEIAARMRSMLSITNDLERIGDIFFQMSKELERKENNQDWFAPEQRKGLNEMAKVVGEAFTLMNENLNAEYGKISLDNVIAKENEINELRDQLRRKHLASFENPEYNMNSAIVYNNLFSSFEKVGDHIINVSEAVAGENIM